MTKCEDSLDQKSGVRFSEYAVTSTVYDGINISDVSNIDFSEIRDLSFNDSNYTANYSRTPQKVI